MPTKRGDKTNATRPIFYQSNGSNDAVAVLNKANNDYIKNYETKNPGKTLKLDDSVDKTNPIALANANFVVIDNSDKTTIPSQPAKPGDNSQINVNYDKNKGGQGEDDHKTPSESDTPVIIPEEPAKPVTLEQPEVPSENTNDDTQENETEVAKNNTSKIAPSISTKPTNNNIKSVNAAIPNAKVESKQELPQTGSKASILSYLGLALAGLGSIFLGFTKRKKN